MSEYKRLTEKSIGNFQYCLKNHKPKVGEFNDYDAFFAYSMAVKRLGEIEDKIEKGTLVETPKIGQTMYGFSVRKQLIEFTVIAITIDSQYNITVWDDDDNDFVVGENGFYSFEQAEAKLKELQEKEE